MLFSTYRLYRLFAVKKQQDKITIEFHLVTAYNIKAKWRIIVFNLITSSFFFSLLLFTIFLGSKVSLNDKMGTFHIWYVFLILISLINLYLWIFCVRPLFIKRIIQFDRHQLTLLEQLFGYQRKLITIPRTKLPPLRRKRHPIEIPHVSNTSWHVRYRWRSREIAGHLLPEAMDLVKDICDRYRNEDFSDFYQQTQDVYLQ